MDYKKFFDILADLASLQDDDKNIYGSIFNIDGYKLVCTSGACPEQYDVLQVNEDGSETNVAYMRLRYGRFYVSCPFGGTVVYETTDVHGDGFFYDDERQHHLNIAIQKIKEFYNNK